MKTVLSALLVLTLAACSQAPQSDTSAAPASAATSSAAAASSVSSDTPTEDATAMLTKYHWLLASAKDSAGQRIAALFVNPDKPLQLDFTSNSLSVSNTCNRMRARYSIDGDQMMVSEFASTLMACANPALMALDKAAAADLRGTLTYAIDRSGSTPELTITTPRNATLVFTGTATPETRYGGKGETVFLEVAPSTKPCNNPGVPNAQCLYVRELHYGANGVREGKPGPWEVLGQNIEGFTHQPGTRNVLRVKRYQVANPPADASSVAYVLDMVVESETTR